MLVGVRAAHHPGFDRVVFDFRGGLPARRDVGWVPALVGDGSGEPVPVAGRAVLQVRFESADAHDAAGDPTAPGRLAFALPNVVSVVRSGDFEAVTTYGIGLARRQPFRVSTLRSPDRVVVDVDAAFRTVPRRVWFFDEGRFLRNEEPFFVPVTRQVVPGAPATGVLDRVFAGPTAAEHARGLRLVASGATGFDRLSISGGTARVRLVGGCSSGGSTVTVAGHLLPSLHQFPAVRRVEVLDPAGRTGRPGGPGDSVPECLEP
ncbi:AMIN-like domain-containing (lipo)protein [Kineococcus terrestris]|uniref:AMIN-like domain-containing (lipo)protein n=1 Tax=Kineococcus terrestris TaxID=2044856 RepID=UPI0034DB69FF